MSAQDAHARNWRIFRLRGLYEQVAVLSGERLARARAAIEEELAAMGAKTCAQKRAEAEAARAAAKERP